MITSLAIFTGGLTGALAIAAWILAVIGAGLVWGVAPKRIKPQAITSI